MAEDFLSGITWEAPEHHHIEKGSDWFWVLGIVAGCAAVAALLFGNFLFALLIIIGASTMALMAARPPAVLPFAVTTRGVRVGDTIYPYGTLAAYRVDELGPTGPQLLLRSHRMFMPLIILPLPEEYVDDVEFLLRDRLPEEDLEEPLANKLLELFGF
jgi:hypothetical protein